MKRFWDDRISTADKTSRAVFLSSPAAPEYRVFLTLIELSTIAAPGTWLFLYGLSAPLVMNVIWMLSCI